MTDNPLEDFLNAPDEVRKSKRELAKLRERKIKEEARLARERNRQRGNATREDILADLVAVQCLVDLGSKVESGRLEIKLIREELNQGLAERFHWSPRKVGGALSALGFKRTANRTYIYYDEELLKALRNLHGV